MFISGRMFVIAGIAERKSKNKFSTKMGVKGKTWRYGIKMDTLKLPYLSLGPGIPKGPADKFQGFMNLDGKKITALFLLT